MTTVADVFQIPASIASDIQKLTPGDLVELFTLDATSIGGPVHNFHAGTNNLFKTIVFGGVAYVPWPVDASGFEMTTKGASPTPTVRIANITSLVSELCRTLNDIVGAKVTRRRTFARYLDAVNFPSGVNPNADPLAKFPDEIWYIQRKVNESKIFVEFELSSASDVEGVMLPRRQVISNCCTWKYRGPECGYVGTAYFDLNDVSTTDPSKDQCSKRLVGCKRRHGQYSELPFGGFPGTGRFG